MPAPNIRVVKVGGSLLDFPLLGERLVDWLHNEPPALSLIVVGGGKLVDAVRELDRVQEFSNEFAHWYCVELLGQTAILLHEMMSKSSSPTLISKPIDLEELLSAQQEYLETSFAVVLPSVFYSRWENAEDLPSNWSTTTDSIAALLAARTQAKELVLLKSAKPPSDLAAGVACRGGESAVWHGLAESGYVDKSFPFVAERVRSIRCVDFRMTGI